MTRPASPVVQRKQLAATLRRLRLAAGLTLEEAATSIEASAATLSRIENSVRVPRARDVRDLCARYAVTDPDRVTALMELAASAREAGWWEAYTEVDDQYATYIGFEAAATVIDQFEVNFVPALLQTPEYTLSVMEHVYNPVRYKAFTPSDVAKRIEVLAKRQSLLEPEAGLRFNAVLDGSVIERAVGGAEVMHQQLEHLAIRARQPNVSLRIIPLTRGAHPGQLGGFTNLTLSNDVSDVVYVDTLAGQLFLEDTTDLTRHRRLFAALEELALTPAQSLDAIDVGITRLNPSDRHQRVE